MADCVFCGLKESNRPFYKNEHFFALFDINPVTPGHAIIIPKRHTAKLFDLNEKEWVALREAVSEVKEEIESKDFKALYESIKNKSFGGKSEQFCEEMLEEFDLPLEPDCFNIGVNIGEKAGQTVDHLHIHLIPRYAGDVEDPTGGVRHVIPKRGNYKP